jgi:hypothetical protein
MESLVISVTIDAVFSQIVTAVSASAKRYGLMPADPVDDNNCMTPCQRKLLNFGPYHLRLHYSENHPQPYLAVTLAHITRSGPTGAELDDEKILDMDINQSAHVVTGEAKHSGWSKMTHTHRFQIHLSRPH